MDDTESVTGGAGSTDEQMSDDGYSTDVDLETYERYLTHCNQIYGYPSFRDCSNALDQYLNEPPHPYNEDQSFHFYNPTGVDPE